MVSNKSSFIAAALLLLLSQGGEAFSPTRPSQVVLSTTQQRNIKNVGRMTTTPLILQMSTDNDNEEVVGLPPLPSDAGKAVVEPQQQSAPPPAAVSEVATSSNTASSSSVEKEEEELLQSYPIDLPSPILLATSMVLAISSIGKF